MGGLCSRSDLGVSEKDESIAVRMARSSHTQQHQGRQMIKSHQEDSAQARNLIDAQDANIAALDPAQRQTRRSSLKRNSRFDTEEDYHSARERVLKLEKTLDFDHRCRANSTPEERIAEGIVQRLKDQDNAGIYGQAPARNGYGGQEHPRFAGDHFLSNLPLINETALFNVARHMPKGAHLHIHFNACLMPQVLLDIAKGMDRMFITSDVPLVSGNHQNFDRCEIQFSIMSPEKEVPGDLFSATYQPRQTMKFKDFLNCFPDNYTKATADKWLLEKLMFHEEEAHNFLQTAAGYALSFTNPQC